MYEPKVNVSRAMFTVMLVNMAGGQADDSATCFLTDVHPGDWYYGAVCWATANGIIDGYDDNTFRPDKSIKMCIRDRHRTMPVAEQMMVLEEAGKATNRIPSKTRDSPAKMELRINVLLSCSNVCMDMHRLSL